MKNLIRSSLVAVATITCAAVASGMPFPVAENNKVFLQEKDSPYVLEQGVVVGATDTLVIESGVTVLMGEFAIMSSAVPFEIKNLTVENAFRNTIFRSSGTLENVNFFNNYYGLWVDESPNVTLTRCTFAHNRYALSVRAGRVVSNGTSISENVYGLYLETDGKLDGDTDLIRNNQESDIRSEAADLKTSKKRVRRNVWHNIEARF